MGLHGRGKLKHKEGQRAHKNRGLPRASLPTADTRLETHSWALPIPRAAVWASSGPCDTLPCQEARPSQGCWGSRPDPSQDLPSAGVLPSGGEEPCVPRAPLGIPCLVMQGCRGLAEEMLKTPETL